ncbi:peptide chain release factor 1 [Deinococcus detaillensis]|uniref:Peptide chain release factor 1 n=1 Tax=Deinococcus detaillensis TaxID=2592048 RepID=A0A553V332_9DEIO|nr:peptide chain release factor 1 [Deinococcus detaillensis]TSA86875.1 peptide chain release factor 1 [Deinococcus detaillensis]
MTPSLSARLSELSHEYALTLRQLADPEVLADSSHLVKLTRRQRELEPITSLYQEDQRLAQTEVQAKELLADLEMRELAEAELEGSRARRSEIASELEVLLLPTDPDDAKDVILEIRAGAGGDEAGLFAADLLRLYERYLGERGYKISILDESSSSLGGFSKVMAEVRGTYAYRTLKFERGVHRVQRVPATETQGRIHTSTVTVAVLPVAEPSDVHLDLADVRIDVYRSQGAGGQSVNTTDSAVRAVYKGGTSEEIMVVCQETRSQIKNREKALEVLRTRLAEREREAFEAGQSANRAAQVGSGDRSEKVRTYNYPQNRVTDHRLSGDDKNFALDTVMGGSLGGVVDALTRLEREALLASMTDGAA